MRALQMRGVNDLALAEVPVPVPAPDDLLIRTVAATICTSDLHDVASNPFGIRLPRVLGHEAAGVVVARGSRATQIPVGTRVAVHPVVPCGTCEECARGYGHLCQSMGHLGLDRDGAFAEYFVQRSDRVRPLPSEVPAALGALLEPVAVCLQAIARAGGVTGRDIMVAGDGPFGNMIARLSARAGARRVLVVGRESFRMGRIRGAETSDHAPTGVMDVAILAVNSAAAVWDCVRALRPRGRLVVFSALPQNAPLDWFSVHVRELEIVGCCNDEERLDEALACLNDPALALEEIVTHEIPFENWHEAWTLARDQHDRALKVALVFPESHEDHER